MHHRFLSHSRATKETTEALYILQMLAGVLSGIGSTTIAAMVVKSEPKLKTPSRRLIFGLSISDIFQSLASVIGPLATVPLSDVDEQHSSKLWNSSGNQRACDFQGFLVLFGGTMCAFYTLALCIYYLCAVKYNMSDEKFGRTTEWKLHVIAFVYSFGTSFFYIVAGLYNNFPDGNMCFVIESPPGCHKNPDIECHRGKHASNFNLSLTFVPLMVIGVGIQYSLGSLYLFVKKDKDRQQKRFTVSMKMNPVSPGQRRGSVVKFSGLNGAGTPIMDNSKFPQNAEDLRDEEAIINTIARMRDNKASRQSNLGRYSARIRRSIFGEDSKFGSIQQSFFRKRSTDISEMYVTRAQRRATEVKRQTLEKALLYVGAYMAVYTLPLLTYFVWYRDGKDQPIPVTIIMHTLFPLQGLLNIYVYTKTKVQAIRKQCQDFSWHKAMWEVIKGGGDIPVHHMRTRRRSRGAGMLGTEVPIELNLRRSKRSGRSMCS